MKITILCNDYPKVISIKMALKGSKFKGRRKMTRLFSISHAPKYNVLQMQCCPMTQHLRDTKLKFTHDRGPLYFSIPFQQRHYVLLPSTHANVNDCSSKCIEIWVRCFPITVLQKLRPNYQFLSRVWWFMHSMKELEDIFNS